VLARLRRGDPEAAPGFLMLRTTNSLARLRANTRRRQDKAYGADARQKHQATVPTGNPAAK